MAACRAVGRSARGCSSLASRAGGCGDQGAALSFVARRERRRHERGRGFGAGAAAHRARPAWRCRRRSTSRNGWSGCPTSRSRSLEAERWASPLRDELRHALVDLLVERHGRDATRVTAPATARRGASTSTFDASSRSPGSRRASRGAGRRHAGRRRAACAAAGSFREPVGDGMLALGGRRKALSGSPTRSVPRCQRPREAPAPAASRLRPSTRQASVR